MPLLGSKRRKTDAALKPLSSSKANEALERTLSTDTSKSGGGPRSATLRSKASSPQLLPRKSDDGSQRRPGLNRNASRSWYGSWNNKASAVAQVVTESISVAGGLTKESSAGSTVESKEPPIHHTLRRSSKSAVTPPEASRVNAAAKPEKSLKGSKRDSGDIVDTEKVDSPDPGATAAFLKNEPQSDVNNSPMTRSPQMKTNPTTQAWLGWWSRPDDYAASEPDKPRDDATDGDTTAKNATVHSKSITPEVHGVLQEQEVPKSATSALLDSPSTKADEPTSRTWFGLWSATQNQSQTAQPPPSGEEAVHATVPAPNPTESAVKDTRATTNDRAEPENGTTKGSAPPSTASDSKQKSTGWAFWSKDQEASEGRSPDGTQKHLGELAVADTPSQSHPEAAQFNEVPEQGVKQKRTTKNTAGVRSDAESTKSAKSVKTTKGSGEADTNKQDKKTILTDSAMATSAKGISGATLSLPEVSKTDLVKKLEAGLTPAAKALKAQQQRPNMVEPQFYSTFPKAHIPSYWESFGYYLGYPFGMAPSAYPNQQHVSINPQKPRIKNAIAIGVHGYFPTPLVSRIIGQPTGTSIRFATHAAAAIRSWVQTNQPDVSCDIEQVALEGEGFIADRVAILWKLLLNWLNQIRNADLILIAAHSQGVPVAIMLAAKLIQLGCLNSQARIGICAMAGVNLGPFADYRSRFFGGSALELFDFSKPDSKVSREYATALDVVFRHGVRVTYVGSLDDQLVSLESSLFANMTHPYIQRAVFVDGRLYEPDFITRLVAFALKLRNLGISDHGLIRELSAPLAGSIYGGEGHSRIYDDDAVYILALQFALESTDVDTRISSRPTPAPSQPLVKATGPQKSSEDRRSQGGTPSTTLLANSIRRGSTSASVLTGIAPVIAPFEIPATGTNANPYFLPWAMRGILEEPVVKNSMQDEVKDLLRLFDEWKPTSKALRDVKFRLEAVKSRL